jgi:hypothetical protein
MYQSHRPSNFSSFPPVVKNLLIINAICFLAYLVLQSKGVINLNQTLGLYYPESVYFKPFQIITHVFMHGSFMHLFFNMFSLWMFGSVLENYWGPKRFFIYYFVTAFGAAALHVGVNAYEVFQVKEQIAGFLSEPNYDQFFKLIQGDHFLANDSQVADFLIGWKANPNGAEYVNGAKEIVDYMLVRKMNEIGRASCRERV